MFDLASRLGHFALTVLIVAAIVCALVWLTHRFAPPGWRTIVFNAVAILAAGIPDVLTLLNGFDWRSLGLDANGAGIAAMGVALANIYWRKKTTAPVPKGDG